MSLRRLKIVAGLALALGLLHGCALLQGAAAVDAAVSAAAAVPAAAAASASGGTASSPKTPSVPTVALLELNVEAPSELKPLLERHLDIARLQALPQDEQLEPGERARLLAATPQRVRELLQTEGYFEPQVTLSSEPGTPPRVRLLVLPGPRIGVVGHRLDFEGPLARALEAAEPQALELRQKLQSSGPLAPGQPFRNADWSDLKKQLLVTLRAAGYGAATLSGSAADIDVATQQARLHVVLDSGPLFRAGELDIVGLQRQDDITVRNLAGFGPGAALTEARLLEFQERLLQTGLYETAAVSFSPEPDQAAAAPVRVRVVEKPLQQATVGLGYSADDGPRTTLEHTHRRPFGLRATAHNKLEWARDSQSWTGDLTSHPSQGFYRNLLGVKITRERSDTDDVVSQSLRIGRTQDTPRIERLAYVELLRSRQTDASGVSAAAALSANLTVTWRNLDSQLLPTRGVALSLSTALGQARGANTQGPFGRLYGKAQLYWPLGGQWYGQLRGEAGQLFRLNGAELELPDALGFRTGGDDSVRGYGSRSLAPLDANGNIMSGSRVLTGGIELSRPVSAQLPSVWGAVFLDAGRAFNHWADYRAARGYGVGVRWRSPIGPLRADLAYGEELRKLRLHFSVGIAF